MSLSQDVVFLPFIRFVTTLLSLSYPYSFDIEDGSATIWDMFCVIISPLSLKISKPLRPMKKRSPQLLCRINFKVNPSGNWGGSHSKYILLGSLNGSFWGWTAKTSFLIVSSSFRVGGRWKFSSVLLKSIFSYSLLLCLRLTQSLSLIFFIIWALSVNKIYSQCLSASSAEPKFCLISPLKIYWLSSRIWHFLTPMLLWTLWPL